MSLLRAASLGWVLFSALPVLATETVADGEDTTLSKEEPTTTHGSAAALYVDGSPGRMALIKFDLHAIKRHTIVKKVSLETWITNTSPHAFEINQMSADWKAGEATWNERETHRAWDRPGSQGWVDRAQTNLGEIRPGTAGHNVAELSGAMVAVVQEWIDSPDHNYGLAIIANGQSDGFILASRNQENRDHVPALILELETPQQQEVHWTFTGPTSVAVNWSGTSERLFYGSGTPRANVAAVPAEPMPSPLGGGGPFWQAQINGLNPDTEYDYSIGEHGVAHKFRTPPKTGRDSDFVIQAIGDIGGTTGTSSGYPWTTQVFGVISRDADTRFAFMLGDLTYAGHPIKKTSENSCPKELGCHVGVTCVPKTTCDPPRKDKCPPDKTCEPHPTPPHCTTVKLCDIGAPLRVDEHFNDVMTWSQDKAYMPAWGNHDWKYQDDLENYKGRFSLPNPKKAPAPPPWVAGCGHGWTCNSDWYWFDYGNTRFIAVPEPYKEDPSHLRGDTADRQAWKAQATAVMDDAQTSTNIDYIVTVGHRSAYASGGEGVDMPLQVALNELAKDHNKYVLDVFGHSHNYERSYPISSSGERGSGVTHITIGTGGAPLLSYLCMDKSVEEDACLAELPAPGWSKKRFRHHGTLVMHFTHKQIDLSMRCAGSDPLPHGEVKMLNYDTIECKVGDEADHFTIDNPNPN